jgi:pimeloyl-ACP methyl ester carboxylesterase
MAIRFVTNVITFPVIDYSKIPPEDLIQEVPLTTRVFWKDPLYPEIDVETKVFHYYKGTRPKVPCILYLHGNIECMEKPEYFKRLVTLYTHSGFEIITFDYPGCSPDDQPTNQLSANLTMYEHFERAARGLGDNQILPSEERMFAAVDAVLATLKGREVIIWGRSLGTVAACHAVTKFKPKGLVLESSVTSAIRVWTGYTALNIPLFESLNNVQVIHEHMKDWPTTLIIHGERDELITPNQAVFLHELIPATATLKIVEGQGHLIELEKFIETFKYWYRFILNRDKIPPV